MLGLKRLLPGHHFRKQRRVDRKDHEDSKSSQPGWTPGLSASFSEVSPEIRRSLVPIGGGPSPVRQTLIAQAGRARGLRSGAAGSPGGLHPANESTGCSLCSRPGTWSPKPPASRSTETPAPPWVGPPTGDELLSSAGICRVHSMHHQASSNCFLRLV
jgi:hypothetical protein